MTIAGHLEQATYWNHVAGPNWVADQRLIDAALHDFGRALLEHANLKPGQLVVDVGCGCGTTTIAIAKRCGRAIGLDISRPMLEAARERADAVGVDALFLEVDASEYQLERSSVDVILSRFGMMFFESPTTAFSNMLRWLRPGGRLVAVCWQDATKNPWLSMPGQIARAYVDVPTRDIEDSAAFSLGDAGRLVGQLVQAGFSEVHLKELAYPLRIDGDLEHAYHFFIERAPIVSSLLSVDGRTSEAAIQALHAAIAAHYDGSGVELGASAWLVQATR